MMILNRVRTTLMCAIAALSQSALAATVFDNGSPNLVSGSEMTEFVVADDFTLASGSNISNIRFWSVQESAADYSGSVSWAIYSDAAGEPAVSLFSGLTNVTSLATGGATGFGYSVFVFDIPVSFTLTAGNFWLGLHNGPLSNTAPSTMLWATTGVGGGTTGAYLDGGWVNSGNEHAFLLDGGPTLPPDPTVPEPQVILMLLAGFAAFSSLRRKEHSDRAASRPSLRLSA
jgi:hypothetical protein